MAKEKLERYQVRMTKTKMGIVKAAAEAEGIPVSIRIRDAIDDYLINPERVAKRKAYKARMDAINDSV